MIKQMDSPKFLGIPVVAKFIRENGKDVKGADLSGT